MYKYYSKELDQGYKFKTLDYKLTMFQIIRYNLRYEMYFKSILFFSNLSINF